MSLLQRFGRDRKGQEQQTADADAEALLRRREREKREIARRLQALQLELDVMRRSPQR